MRRGDIFALLARLAVAFLLLVPSAHAALFGDDVARKQAADAARRVDELRNQTDVMSARIGKIEDSLRNQPRDRQVGED